MAEEVESSFSFSVLDSNDNLYIVKGDSPISILHFKKKTSICVCINNIDTLESTC